MKWVRCDANGKYAPLQCNTKNCFCVSTYSGLRVGSTVYPPKVNNTNVCDKSKCDTNIATHARSCAHTYVCAQAHTHIYTHAHILCDMQ